MYTRRVLKRDAVAASALKIWEQAGGSVDPAAAVLRLDEVERSMLGQDAVIWKTLGEQPRADPVA
ncbi:hypothetical protein [uncultured Ruegeria sp.]|uniref:hypothetical protein n=1 Tax=uncultured Ruegeria sp. TaxID=259304 RepID=UPI0026150C42|nr:hypothetical protein [uncultured Ruegeria sp.]